MEGGCVTHSMQRELRKVISLAGWNSSPPCDPANPADYLSLLTVLYDTGRRDLPLGRLLEGHVDATQIVQRYGTAEQRERLLAEAAQGALLGVWNATLQGEPLRLDGDLLCGGKAYASGAGILTFSLVTADTPDGSQLLLLDLERTPPEVDRNWWRTTGMQRSETHLARWYRAIVRQDDILGPPNVYATEPFFSGGALRFVAVQAGGIAGLFDRARDHLVGSGRAEDPFQSARLSELFALADAAAGVVRRAADLSFVEPDDVRAARVASARLSITTAAERAIELAQHAVGLPGMFVDHPLAANLSDLTVYLRQPAPDAQRLRVGSAVAAGILSPAL